MLSWIMKVFLKLGKARWIVDSDGEVGFVVFGVVVVSHKWSDSFLVFNRRKLDDEKLSYREIEKREISGFVFNKGK